MGTERKLRKQGWRGREEGREEGREDRREEGRKENLRGRGRHGETATEARAGDRWTTLTSVLRRKTEQKVPAGHLLWVWRQPALAVS